jgi:hypothetical protein
VAAILGINRDTLGIRFRDELKKGRSREFLQVITALDRAAKRGSVSAMKCLLTLFSNGALFGKKQRQQQGGRSGRPW